MRRRDIPPLAEIYFVAELEATRLSHGILNKLHWWRDSVLRTL